MRQLTPLDSAFLYFETPHSPMHIGGVYIYEGKGKGSPYSYLQFLEHIRSRLHVAKVFKERIVEVPMDLDLPYWIEDPEFDLELHCPRAGLVPPRNKQALMTMAAEIFSRPLDRSRPLWEATFIEGLDGFKDLPKGSFAIVFKVHHCAIDGISGEEILASLLDITEVPRVEPNNQTGSKIERIPTGPEMLAKSFGPTLKSPFQLARFLAKSGRVAWSSIYKRVRETKLSPPLYFEAPKARFDSNLSPHRIFASAELPLKTIKEIKNFVEGCTVNDVVLAVAAGALRRYLEEKQELPSEPLVAMAPVSTRTEQESGSFGNKVSSMLVSLATNIDDPLKRLQQVHKNAGSSKEYNKAVDVSKLIDYMPSVMESMVARLFTHIHISDQPQPIFNIVLTNVPGPQIPLYFDGMKLHSQFGMAPIVDGMGLMLVVMSYDGNVGIGVTSCRELMPDVANFAQYLEDSLAELEAAVLGSKRLEEEKQVESVH